MENERLKASTYYSQINIVISFMVVVVVVVWIFFRLETFRNIQIQRTTDDAGQWEAIKANQESIQAIAETVQNNSQRVQALTLRVDALMVTHIQPRDK